MDAMRNIVLKKAFSRAICTKLHQNHFIENNEQFESNQSCMLNISDCAFDL